jgi:hypothetical protein
MLFLSDHNEETTDFILPGQTDILEHMTTTGSLKNSINSYYGKTTPKSEITINKGILTLITENMTVKVKATKLIGYIAGARNESVILIFKKNNITVPIKNKVTFKTIIVLLDEILSKRNCIFWPF